MFSFIQGREENLKIAWSSPDYNWSLLSKAQVYSENNNSKWHLTAVSPQLHAPSYWSSRFLSQAVALACMDTGPPASSISARCLLSPHTHTHSLLHPIFSLALPRVPQTQLHHPMHLTSQQWAATAFSFHGWHRRGGEQRKAGRQDSKHQTQQGICREAISNSQCLPFTCTPQTRPFLQSNTQKLPIVTSSLCSPTFKFKAVFPRVKKPKQTPSLQVYCIFFNS